MTKDECQLGSYMYTIHQIEETNSRLIDSKIVYTTEAADEELIGDLSIQELIIHAEL